MKFGIVTKEKINNANKKVKKVKLPLSNENKGLEENLLVKGKLIDPSKLIYNQVR